MANDDDKSDACRTTEELPVVNPVITPPVCIVPAQQTDQNQNPENDDHDRRHGNSTPSPKDPAAVVEKRNLLVVPRTQRPRSTGNADEITADRCPIHAPIHMYHSVDDIASNRYGLRNHTDTVCSNRSDFFKYYYQRTKSGESNNSRGSPTITKICSPTSSQGNAEKPRGRRRSSIVARMHLAEVKTFEVCRQQVHFSWLAMALLCVTLIASIVVIVQEYKIHRAKYTLFGRIKFSEAERRLSLLDVRSADGRQREMARIFIADGVPTHARAYDCGSQRFTRVSHASKYLAHSTRHGNGVCLEWKRRARLRLQQVRHDRFNCSTTACRQVQCFRVAWQALTDAVSLRDCFSMRYPSGNTWYIGTETASGRWRLNDLWGSSSVADQLITGDVANHSVGRLVNTQFVSSQGVGVFAWNSPQLELRVDSANQRWCLGATPRSWVGSVSAQAGTSMVYYTCAGADMSQIVKFSASTRNPYTKDYFRLQQTLRNDVKKVIFAYPETVSMSQESVLAFSDLIQSGEYAKSMVLVLDKRWQQHQGDLIFNNATFQSPRKMIEQLQQKEIQLAITLTSIVELKSFRIDEGIDKGFWIRHEGALTPAMINVHGVKGVCIDFTNEATQQWMKETLVQLRTKTNITTVVLDPLPSQHLPHNYQLHTQLDNPDHMIAMFAELVRSVGLQVLFSTTVGGRQFAVPTFVQLSRRATNWQGLARVLPSSLAAVTGGTSLLMPAPVPRHLSATSHRAVHESNTSRTQPDNEDDDERELYIRWLQLAAFLPRFQLLQCPSELGEDVDRIAKYTLSLRRTKIVPVFESTLHAMLTQGESLIRALWYHHSDEPDTLNITDQFMVGENMVVAPVLQPRVNIRMVYLPSGSWKEVNSGEISAGGRWLRQNVTIDTIPFYQRVEND